MKKWVALALACLLLAFAAAAIAQQYTDKSTIKTVQQQLNDRGYDCGAADGVIGKKTRAAIAEFQNDQGLAVTGRIDDALLSALNSDSASIEGKEITGDFDTPALINPEERYEIYTEKTDGSEQGIFLLLDGANDEAADIEEYGALYITENMELNSDGKPMTKAKMSIQDSPCGKMMIMETRILWIKNYAYCTKDGYFIYDGDTVEQVDDLSEDEFAYYCESYHFPYGPLQTLNGVRQDENGYAYFLVQSTDTMSFEFVTAGLRILQTRVYEKNSEGQLALISYVDYDVGEAWEIPQPVIDALEA
ncbi:MAG: peptidoglycan-binding domain-containing protein [Clostridia bacterium]|nr:peptidoglycan-binding domain-containing protein [Clostridia bacterium]